MIYRKISQIIILAAITITVTLSGCVKGKFDQAPLYQTFQLSADDSLVSIAELKKLHNPLSSLLDTVKTNKVISGIIISNDSCGNNYKYITIQDTSGGICIGIENGETYTKYRLGQRIYVKCKGLILGGQIFSLSGAHLTSTQLGYKEGLAIGGIPDALKTNYIFREGFPGAVPEPKEITAFDQLSDKLIGTLVKIKNIHFDPSSYVNDGSGGDGFGSLFNNYNKAPVRDLRDSIDFSDHVNSKKISFAVSPYTCFSKDTIPSGVCDITGILLTYDANNTRPGYLTGSYQLNVRSKKDIQTH